MDAAISDFLDGLLRECRDLAEDWRHRRPPGLDARLARLTCWTALARALPADLDGPNGPRIDFEPATYRRLWGEARALTLLAASGRPEAGAVPALVERLYAAMASRFEPQVAWNHPDARDAVAAWAEHHFAGPESDPARAAAAYLDFVRLAPLSWGDEAMAALLAAVLAGPKGAPMLLVLTYAERAEEGYRHALEAGLDGDVAAWMAFYLGQARRVLKRLPALAEGTETLRRRWVDLFARAPIETSAGETLAEVLTALPVITPAFIPDTGTPGEVLRDALIMLVAADDAVELLLPGQGFTVLPRALRLLVR
ncbi:hypothetical protein [Magnetospirillum sp. UT-4]|uniref:hypothetical protein n=1 Tax=Magnetospirillum sp. UT-4 TaxID=2681467 RepID=UPI00137FB877|nr:hypothetical protein [Magnetospirillum sp. UT-4]CAA7611788.1 hypothetical protein MTBUT4_100081 [Magnetospirillum sp. UT-4]